MKKIILFLTGIASLVILAGCFDVSEEVWIRNEKSARIKIDIAVYSEEIPSFGSESLQEAVRSFREDMANDMEAKKKNIEKMPGIKQVETGRAYEEKLDHFIYDVRVSDIYAFDGVYRQIYHGQLSEEADWGIEVEKLENGNILFRQLFTYAGEEKKEPISEDKSQEGPERYFRITLYAPGIVSTNGALSEDKKVVQWEASFSDLERLPEKREFRAEIKPGAANYAVFALIALCIIAAGCGAGYFFVRKVRK